MLSLFSKKLNLYLLSIYNWKHSPLNGFLPQLRAYKFKQHGSELMEGGEMRRVKGILEKYHK